MWRLLLRAPQAPNDGLWGASALHARGPLNNDNVGGDALRRAI